MTISRKFLAGETVRWILAAILALALAPLAAAADELSPTMAMSQGAVASGGATPTPMKPPPASLSWTAVAPAGQFMLSYTPTFMGMRGNYIGDSKVSDAYIATHVPSSAGTMMRVVPDTMTMQMHMFSAMYGVTDSLSVMAMASYVDKWMSMTTFKGMSGSTVLGSSAGSNDGFGDVSVGANYKLYQDPVNRVVAGLFFSLPTGSQTANVTMLNAKGAYVVMRAPYAMQLGTGTVDLAPSLAYTGALDRWSWGLAYRGRFPLDTNAEGYRFGNLNELHAWGGYDILPGVTTTIHAVGSTQDHIHGSDPVIAQMAMSQNADPFDYGGQRVSLLGGVALSGSLWGYSKSSLEVEAGGPVYQRLNGPQLGQAWQVALSGRVRF